MPFKYKSLVSAIALSSTLVACGTVENIVTAPVSATSTPEITPSPSLVITPTAVVTPSPSLAVSPTVVTTPSSSLTVSSTTVPTTIVTPTSSTVTATPVFVVEIDSSIAPQNQVTQKLDTAKQGVEGATKSFSASAASSLSSISSMLAPLSEIVSQGESGGVEAASQPLVKAYKAFSSEYKTLATRSAVTEAENALNISAADMEALMMAYFEVESAVLDEANNTITLKLNSSDICGSDSECLTVANKVTLSIAAINENAGVITLMYGNSSPLQLAYEPSAIAVLVDLAEFKTAVIALASDQGIDISSDFPSTFEGQAVADIHVTENTVELSAWIEKAISLGDEQNNITMAATDNLATVKLDADAKTIHTTADVNAINGSIDVMGNGILDIAFAGGTADVLVDAHMQKIIVRDTGTDGAGLMLTLNNDTILEATLTKLSATLNMADNYALFDSALDATLSGTATINNCNDYVSSIYRTVDVDITSGTYIDDTNIYNGTMTLSVMDKDLDTGVIEIDTDSISDGDSLNDLSVNISGTRCTSAVVTPTAVPILPTATIATVAPSVMPTAVF